MADSRDSVRKSLAASEEHDYGDAPEQRELPGVLAFLRPRYFFGFVIGFLERWLLSRNLSRVMLSLPFIVMGIGGAGFLWWLQTAPRDAQVRLYEEAAARALRAGEVEKSNLYLQALVQLRPADKNYKFNSALQLLENGQEARGYSYLRELTVDGPDGFNRARIWLAAQAQQPDSPFAMTEKEIESLLRLVYESEPENVHANQMLANININKGNLKAAEDHLRKAVESAPELGIAFVELLRKLKRSDEQIDHHLKNAADHFQDALLKDPSSVEACRGRAQAYVLAGKKEDAERVLKEGLALNDSPELRQSLAQLYASDAAEKIRVSPLNAQVSYQQLVLAGQLAPSDRSILLMILELANGGVAASKSDLAPMIDSILAQEELSFQDEVIVVEALAATGQNEKAVSRIEPLIEEHPELRPRLARLYRAADQLPKSDSLTRTLLSEYEPRQEELTLSETLQYVDVLMLAERSGDARSVLKAAMTRFVEQQKRAVDGTPVAKLSPSEQVEYSRANTLFGRLTIAAFDNQLKKNSFSSPEDALALLEQALQTRVVNGPVLARLADMAFSKGELADHANSYLTKLLASGSANADVYNYLGTRALEAGDPAKARELLERAYALNRSNEMVLNNLAIALVRQNAQNAERALALVNEAMEIVPDYPDALSTRGEVLIAMERWEEALTDLEIALRDRPRSKNVHKLLIQVLLTMGEENRANEHRRILKELEDQVAETGNGLGAS